MPPTHDAERKFVCRKAPSVKEREGDGKLERTVTSLPLFSLSVFPHRNCEISSLTSTNSACLKTEKPKKKNEIELNFMNDFSRSLTSSRILLGVFPFHIKNLCHSRPAEWMNEWIFDSEPWESFFLSQFFRWVQYLMENSLQLITFADKIQFYKNILRAKVNEIESKRVCMCLWKRLIVW